MAGSCSFVICIKKSSHTDVFATFRHSTHFFHSRFAFQKTIGSHYLKNQLNSEPRHSVPLTNAVNDFGTLQSSFNLWNWLCRNDWMPLGLCPISTPNSPISPHFPFISVLPRVYWKTATRNS